MVIINSAIKTMAKSCKNIQNGYIVTQKNRIIDIGDMKNFTLGNKYAELYDARGKTIVPGFVDAHTHLGLFEDSLGFEGEDCNEDTDPITPNLRALDGINPMEKSFLESLNSGVTSVLVSPGSSNAIGGQICAVKTYGKCVDEMIIKDPVAIKFALGENPKSVYHGKNQSPVTRMAIAALIRETLNRTLEYVDKLAKSEQDDSIDKPDFDAKLHALIPLIRGEIPAHFHAHRTDDIFTAIRIAEEFNLKCVIVHGTQAHLVADSLSDKNIPIISGPFLIDRSKPELSELSSSSPVILNNCRINVCITTDHPATPLKYLIYCAVEAIKQGMSENDALACITINSAKIAGIDSSVGSLEIGKDADLVVFDGNPFDYKSKLCKVMISGKFVEA